MDHGPTRVAVPSVNWNGQLEPYTKGFATIDLMIHSNNDFIFKKLYISGGTTMKALPLTLLVCAVMLALSEAARVSKTPLYYCKYINAKG